MGMNYLLLICSDGVPTADKTATMRREIPAWTRATRDRGVSLYGDELAGPAAAKTVRVRDGQTLVSDGPFIEAKEFVGGFDILDCTDLDEAIEIAAKHPVSWFHMVEVRPFATDAATGGHTFMADDSGRRDELAAMLAAPVADGATRYLLTVCVDGIPETDEEEAAIARDAEAWVAEMGTRGIRAYGHALAPADTATTVRVRDGETLLTDGPFIETKEFIGGFDLIDCAGVHEAVAVAAEHPLARFHMIEVRPLAQA
jgi:hypothetical protein